MTLVQNWRRLLVMAWSVRLIVLAGLMSGLEVVLPMFVDSMPRNVFAALSLLAAVGAAVARFVVQPKIERRKAPRKPLDPERADYD